MNTLEVLKAARSRIARGWLQGNYASDRSGNYVRSNSAKAVSWCCLGAIYSCMYDDTYVENALPRTIEEAASCLSRQLAPTNINTTGADYASIIRFNDRIAGTQREVLALFDKAIAKLEGPKPLELDPCFISFLDKLTARQAEETCGA